MYRPRQAPAKTLIADARAALDTCAGLNSRTAARRITRFLETWLATAGLSLAQFALMARIAAARDDTIGVLALSMDLDPSTLSRNLRALEREGLVEIGAVDKDLRRRAVWLTESGALRLEAAMPVWREAHARLSEKIDPATVRALADMTAALWRGSN